VIHALRPYPEKVCERAYYGYGRVDSSHPVNGYYGAW
jgi:hypothetical protein